MVLAVAVALLRSKPVPVRRLFIVLFYTVSILIQHAKIKLPRGSLLVRQLLNTISLPVHNPALRLSPLYTANQG